MSGLFFGGIISLLFIISPSRVYVDLLLLQIFPLSALVLLALLKVLQQFVFELAVRGAHLFLHLRTTFVEKELVILGFLRSDKGSVVFFERDWSFGGM